MSPAKRRTTRPARRTAARRPVRARIAASQRASKASKKNRTTATEKREIAARKRAAEIFEREILPVWTRFGEECEQFAEGFNSEIGSHQLHVESAPDSVVVKFALGGEVLVQLDRGRRHIECWISSHCGSFGSCIVEQPQIGLTIEADRLRFVYGANPMSEDDLAVRLLTDLIQSNAPSAAAASHGSTP